MSESTGRTTTRVTDKGQTTIPKELREKFGIEPGDEVVWVETEEGMVLQKASNVTGRGMLVDETLDRDTREEIAEAFRSDLRESRETEWAIE